LTVRSLERRHKSGVRFIRSHDIIGERSAGTERPPNHSTSRGSQMAKQILTQKYVREALDYIPETGELYWRADRPAHHFPDEGVWKCWLSRFPGKRAGCQHHLRGGYWVLSISSHPYRAARVIWLWMTGEMPRMIDHINGDPSDDRWANLRSVSRTKNMRNLRLQARNKTGHPGVWWDEARGNYQAFIGIGGKRKSLGRFSDLSDAVAARALAEREYGYHQNHGRC